MGQLLQIEQWAENLQEVTLGRWIKAEGDEVEIGESICEIITEKVTFEYESPMTGVLTRIYAAEKSVVPVGYAFAFLGAPGEAPPEGVEERNARLLEKYQAQTRLEIDLDAAPAAGGAPAGGRVRATPGARRAARERGVELAAVAEWMGEDRPVSEEDVARYLAREAS
jgi:pyruvate/2-oxoglutarate dehydrogenase complex dihydrolipoamide acyltransferase (E2) component